MKNGNKIIPFGEHVAGYDIPVLNEREIRTASGILFVLMFVAILTAILKSDFTLLKYAVTIFLTDILIRVLINPRYSPSLIIGRLIVRNQTPEYVGAQQKKFAWGASSTHWSPRTTPSTAPGQMLIVFGFTAYIILTVVLFQDNFRTPPFDLIGLHEAH
jgi:hypothetical protein